MNEFIGRPSKGERDAILARPSQELGAIIRERARLLRFSNGEYMVFLAAEYLGRHEFKPEPSIRRPGRDFTKPNIRNGRDAILAKPPVEFGRLLKRRARDEGVSYGDYLITIASKALSANTPAV